MVDLLLQGSAVLSGCGIYRYELRRTITASDRVAAFIMLNPSTADAEQDDPTIRRCIGFARALGCGKLIVANLFAFRATKPGDMKRARDPVGPINDQYIFTSARKAMMSGGPIICAWGAHGSFRDRDMAVLAMLHREGMDAMSLGETAANMPRHPLYLRGDCKPLLYRKEPRDAN